MQCEIPVRLLDQGAVAIKDVLGGNLTMECIRDHNIVKMLTFLNFIIITIT